MQSWLHSKLRSANKSRIWKQQYDQGELVVHSKQSESKVKLVVRVKGIEYKKTSAAL